MCMLKSEVDEQHTNAVDDEHKEWEKKKKVHTNEKKKKTNEKRRSEEKKSVETVHNIPSFSLVRLFFLFFFFETIFCYSFQFGTFHTLTIYCVLCDDEKH